MSRCRAQSKWRMAHFAGQMKKRRKSGRGDRLKERCPNEPEVSSKMLKLKG